MYAYAGNATASHPVVEELCQYVDVLPSIAFAGPFDPADPEAVATPPQDFSAWLYPSPSAHEVARTLRESKTTAIMTTTQSTAAMRTRRRMAIPPPIRTSVELGGCLRPNGPSAKRAGDSERSRTAPVLFHARSSTPRRRGSGKSALDDGEDNPTTKPQTAGGALPHSPCSRTLHNPGPSPGLTRQSRVGR